MSRLLAEPITEKQSHLAINHEMNLRIGKSAMQGWRESMEDVDIVEEKLATRGGPMDLCCVAIFDGHGGSTISMAASKLLLQHVREHPDLLHAGPKPPPETLAAVLCDAFLQTDTELMHSPEIGSSCDETGSTGVVALITHSHVVVANVGDSRAILSNAQTDDALELSRDHKPAREFEKERIVAAGGAVFNGRVCGGVAVSRSFGDYWFKRNADLPAYQQLVTAEPCIHMYQRQKDDEFLVLACDGIYDVMSNNQLRDFVRREVKRGASDPAQVCERVLDECLHKLSRDNMSAIIVFFG